MSTCELQLQPALEADEITADYVRSILDYDPETGVLTWRERADMRPQWNAKYAGKRAGCQAKGRRTCYRHIKIDGRKYREHRVCYLHYHGQWPDAEIDHVDGDGLNNRIKNLRGVSRAENMRNQRKYLNNTSGVNGVVWHRQKKKWEVRIWANGCQKHLGYFDGIEDAASARTEVEKQLGFSDRHGRED